MEKKAKGYNRFITITFNNACQQEYNSKGL